MSKSTSPYPRVSASATGTGVVSQAGTVLLLRTAEKTGLAAALTTELAPYRKPLARHDPGKIVLDLATALAIGGDCLADIAQLRAHPEIFGAVASDPTVSRLISVLATDADTALAAIGRARATARSHAWAAAGTSAPDHAIDEAHPLVLDIDATLVTAHSEKEQAAPTFKRGFGFHPLCAFVDHGTGGTGEPVAMLLRPGNSGSNTAADHITVVQDALAQLPVDPAYRVGKKVLVRIDGAGGTHGLIEYLTKRRLSYSVGFGLTETMVAALELVPDQAWTPAYDSDGQVRDGAWVTELTGLLDLSSWPKGMRVIVRKERPHPGAQLRFTDRDGLRLTAFVTNTRRGQLPDLELRHRRRARCEDRIRTAKVTGLQNLPLHGFDQNRIWLALVQLACELIAWMQMLALTDVAARRWEPKRLRLRLLSIAGRVARHARRVRLRLAATAPDIDVLVAGLNRLEALPAPA
ncbi:IS1380-like element ISRer1 family transposase [Rhodococcus rhodochrous]|mgnify:FL=1|uniref:IS1380-like element ISRer1 family transposase n=3 Tax=Rhodococcus TaxID=1827 RepID=A0AA46WXV6_RHORH|nr:MULTISPECIES: IS1380-like element ISRer1 family transposase [Rhodococcus]AAP74046.1 putative transposase [Rhodococcus erythropolis]AYA23139.1 IS1380-like element ISRer1 family transposase [Rhodococcus rhodochrous]UZF42913.1 IS1380-like element ISRer1 family transposase [Rhodococcus rhodochrous]UZF43190.1 IS1380-like element ISRer1 family transposase [Rhodococcus rhodochrous]UZF45719.1 IS1380-like element ISRer1 family transposase [Rhodococcus rhodochrous]